MDDEIDFSDIDGVVRVENHARRPQAALDFSDVEGVVRTEGGPPTQGDAFARGFSKGATLGFSDEFEGLTGAVVRPGMFDDLGKPLTTEQIAQRDALQAQPFGERMQGVASRLRGDYGAARDDARAKDHAVAEAHPWTFTGGQVVGSLAPGAALPMRSFGQAALVGGGLGAVGGVGRSEGDTLGEFAKDAALGGGLGALGGGVGYGVGKGVERGARWFLGKLAHGSSASGQALAGHSQALGASQAIDDMAPAFASVDDALAKLRQQEAGINEGVKGLQAQQAEAERKMLEALHNSKLNPHIEAARQLVKEAEGKAAHLTLDEQQLAQAAVQGDKAAEQALERALGDQTRVRAALDEAQRTLDSLKTQRRMDPAVQRFGREKFDLGLEAKKARAPLKQVRADVASKQTERAALESTRAGLQKSVAEAQAVPGAKTLGDLNKALTPENPLQAVVVAATSPLSLPARAVLNSPSRSKAFADRLLKIAERSASLQRYLPHLTSGTEGMAGTGSQGIEIVLRHLDLLEDPAYRDAYERGERLHGGQGGGE